MAAAARKTLADIGLHIRSGETVGVIGGTGSGKSSLVNLIQPASTTRPVAVCGWGGIDVRRYDMEALRDQVAVVLQKNVLFTGTILDNLRWGKSRPTRRGVRGRSTRLACADEFISRLPDGYDTHIGAGRLQRLRRAEAAPVHRQSPRRSLKVLILDDLPQRGGLTASRTPKSRAALSRAHSNHQDHHRPARFQRGTHADRICAGTKGNQRV